MVSGNLGAIIYWSDSADRWIIEAPGADAAPEPTVEEVIKKLRSSSMSRPFAADGGNQTSVREHPIGIRERPWAEPIPPVVFHPWEQQLVNAIPAASALAPNSHSYRQARGADTAGFPNTSVIRSNWPRGSPAANDRAFIPPLQCEREANNLAKFAQVTPFMTSHAHIPSDHGKSGRFSGGKLGHGRELDVAVGSIGVSTGECPPLPDEVMTDPLAGLLDPRRWFGDPARRFEIEIGCGKGTFMLNAAKETPDTNFLGIEWEGAFFAYTADRVRRASLANVRMLHADAVEFLKWRCPDAIVHTIHLYYSDPWPKAKHHKNRVVQDRFLEQVRRVLVPGGDLRIVTDHDDYWQWMEAHFCRWTNAATTPGGVPFIRESFIPPEWVGEGQVVATNYEKKMCGDTKAPHATVLRKSG